MSEGEIYAYTLNITCIEKKLERQIIISGSAFSVLQGLITSDTISCCCYQNYSNCGKVVGAKGREAGGEEYIVTLELDSLYKY